MSIVGRGISVGGGGALKLKIVGGTTQPSNPKENTLWIKTSDSIGNVYIHQKNIGFPTTPTVGDVIIYSGANAYADPIVILEKPNITIEPQFCFQYANSGWIGRESAYFSNSTWHQLSYLVVYTDEILAPVSGWEAYATKMSSATATAGLPTISQNGNAVDVKAASGRRGTAAYLAKIDFSKYASMQLKCTTSAAALHEFGVVAELPESNYTFLAYKQEQNKATSKTMSVDISSISSEGYIAIGVYNLTLTIEQIILLPS